MKHLSNPQVITTIEDLPRHAADLFQQVDKSLQEIAAMFEVQTAAPVKPRPGNIVYADGTVFNPGGFGYGEGYYFWALAQWFPMFNVGPRRVTGFGASGVYTKPSWLRMALAIVKGGGGGGGSGQANLVSGAGGGEAALSVNIHLASALGATVAVTVGVGGVALADGGNSAFGGQIAGGGKGVFGAHTAGGIGGTGYAGAVLVIPGAMGGNGVFGPNQNGGNGGGSGGGRGGVIGLTTVIAGYPGSGGGGGGGANSTTVSEPGAGGGSGFVLVLEF
jgi:hypothetical protein